MPWSIRSKTALALFPTLMLGACNPGDVADTLRRNQPPPAAVCTRDIPVPYPKVGENWRAVALKALETAEQMHGHRVACADWYARLRTRYAKG